MHILILEDEPIASRRIQKMVQEILPGEHDFTALDSIESTVEWLDKKVHADIILMDIHLADGSSFELFNYSKFENQAIIFTTAYDEYAIKAFKVNAIDYLLKPIKKEELQFALEKAVSRKSNKISESSYIREQSLPNRLMIKIGTKYKVVPMEEINYFFSRDKITYICAADGRKFPVDFTLDQLDKMLDSQKFFRINRHTIAHMSAIAQINTHTKSRLKIELNPPVDMENVISFDKVGAFKEWMKWSR